MKARAPHMVESLVQPFHNEFQAYSLLELIQLIVGHVNNLFVGPRREKWAL